MSATINDGGAFHPHAVKVGTTPGGGDDVRLHTGISLRDYFAAAALANKFTEDEASDENVARWAYRVADAMLAAREAKP